MRILVLAVALLAAVAPGAAAQLPAGLGPEGRVFTLIGDGNASPADGVPAHRVAESLLDLGRFAPLPRPGRSRSPAAGTPARQRSAPTAWSACSSSFVDIGRRQRLPPTALSTPSSATRSSIVGRLAGLAGTCLRPALQIPRWRQFDDEVESIAAWPGGGFVFTADRGAFRVGDDGIHAEIALPRGSEPEYVAATAGGDAVVVVIDDRARERVVTVPAGGTPVTLGLRGIFGIATAPGGVLLRSAGTLDAFGTDGARLVRVGSGAPIGLGDGGPAAAARIVALGTLAERDGAVFTDDVETGGLEHVTEEQGGVEVPLPFLGSGFGTRVRVFTPPGTPMPLAAVARGTYETLDEGAVAVESTFAGRATVVVRREGVEVARASATCRRARAPWRSGRPRRAATCASASRSWRRTAASRAGRWPSRPRAGSRGSTPSPSRTSSTPSSARTASSRSPAAGGRRAVDPLRLPRAASRPRPLRGEVPRRAARRRAPRHDHGRAAGMPDGVTDSGVAVRVALFITCFNDTLFPDAGRATVACSSGSAARSSSGRSRPAAGRCTATRATRTRRGAARALRARLRGAEAIVSPERVVRGLRPRAAARTGPPVYELTRVPHRRARRRGRRRLVPAPRDAAPDLPLAARPAGRRRAASGCCAPCAGSTSWSWRRRRSAAASAGRSRSRTPTPRWRCSADKLRRVLDTRAEVCTAVDTSCLMHIGGALRRQRAGVRTMHIAEILAAQDVSTTGFPAAARAARCSDTPAAPQPRQGDDGDPGQARAAVAELRRLGGAARRRARRSRRARWRRCPSSSSGWRSAVTARRRDRALGARRRRGERDRRRHRARPRRRAR